MKFDTFTNSKYLWQLAMALTMLVYLVGMLVTAMEIDGAVYAEISREMYRSGNWAELFLKGQDWLDKPHFQFWMTAISFNIFGISSFSYKLPAVLFMLLGIYYTYKFGESFYSKKHGYIAALLLMTSQHIITSNTDVRAEPYLTGLTIFSLYYLAIYIKERQFYLLVLGSLGLACLLMTKGLFTIIPTASGLGLALLYERRWKEILHWQWLAVVALTFVFIIPALYGYYIQFDAQPDKIVFDSTNVSGIKFFFWDSQWGRFTNTGPIQGAGDPTFYLHTLLWAYMPWAFLAYFALFSKARSLLLKVNRAESYTFFGFIFLFVVFSISQFQLPHYLNPLFPFLSILVADSLVRFERNRKFLKVFYHIHFWSAILLMITVVLLHFVFSNQPLNVDLFFVFLLGIGIITILYLAKGHLFKKIIFIPAIAILMVNYYINRSFYPQLLKYQSESELAFYMKEHALEKEKLVSLGLREEMVSFLQDRIVPKLELASVSPDDLSGKYVFTDGEGILKLKSLALKYEEIEAFPDFRITTLNGTFINKKTREKEIELKYLLKVQ